jgi:hypothetical protein
MMHDIFLLRPLPQSPISVYKINRIFHFKLIKRFYSIPLAFIQSSVVIGILYGFNSRVKSSFVTKARSEW